MKKLIHIKVRVTESEHKAIKVKTAKEGTTTQDVLHEAAKQYLEDKKSS